MKKVTCAGCNSIFNINETYFHRKKRCCGNPDCIEIIDEKVKNANYKKKQSRMEKGTFRNGVDKELREYILDRDNNRCRLCNYRHNSPYMMQVHHIIPVSSNGADDKDNLCTLCKPCHLTVHQDGWEKYVDTFKISNKKIGA